MIPLDFTEDQIEHPGFYLVTYGRADLLEGPFDSVPEMARVAGLRDYPDNGYVIYSDGDRTLSTVPSLNPDDLLPGDDWD